MVLIPIIALVVGSAVGYCTKRFLDSTDKNVTTTTRQMRKLLKETGKQEKIVVDRVGKFCDHTEKQIDRAVDHMGTAVDHVGSIADLFRQEMWPSTKDNPKTVKDLIVTVVKFFQLLSIIAVSVAIAGICHRLVPDPSVRVTICICVCTPLALLLVQLWLEYPHYPNKWVLIVGTLIVVLYWNASLVMPVVQFVVLKGANSMLSCIQLFQLPWIPIPIVSYILSGVTITGVGFACFSIFCFLNSSYICFQTRVVEIPLIAICSPFVVVYISLMIVATIVVSYFTKRPVDGNNLLWPFMVLNVLFVPYIWQLTATCLQLMPI